MGVDCQGHCQHGVSLCACASMNSWGSNLQADGALGKCAAAAHVQHDLLLMLGIYELPPEAMLLPMPHTLRSSRAEAHPYDSLRNEACSLRGECLSGTT